MININPIQALDRVGRRIVIVTHPRSGTHLTIDLLRKQFSECQSWLWFGETLHHAYLNLDHLTPYHSPHITQKKAIDILHRSQYPIIKTHSLPNFKQLGVENAEFTQKLLQNAEIYYVVRDGRDVLCSAHVWMQNFNPSARCSLSDFLRQKENGRSRPQIWANHILSWLSQRHIQIIRFEEILKNPHQLLNQIGSQLGIQPLYIEPLLPRKKKSDSRWEHYWLRLTRQFESTAIAGRYQGHKPQRWQESFTYEDRKFFHEEAGEILIRLGYEVSDAWVEVETLKIYK